MTTCTECYKDIPEEELFVSANISDDIPGSPYHKECWKRVVEANGRQVDIASLRRAADESKQEEDDAELRFNLLKGKWFIKGAEALVRTTPLYYDKTRAWWVWNHNTMCWEEQDETHVLNRCRKSLMLIGDTSVRHSSNLVKALQQVGRETSPTELPPAWIQFGTTLFNVLTGEQRLSTPEWFSTNSIPWDIGESTKTPVMDDLITSWVGDEYLQTIYEIIAYCTYRDYPIHRIFCFVGSGANGKTRLLKIIEKFIGEHNKASVNLRKINENSFALYPMYRKLVCFVGETTHHKLDTTEVLKALSGQDPVSFEAKGRNAFTGQNYAKLIIGTNVLPPATDTSRGWFRRWFVINFPNEFQEGEDVVNRIPDEEYKNLAAKCIRILPALLERGQFTNEGTIEHRKKKYIQNSNPIKQFLSQQYYRNPDAEIRYSECYTTYLSFLSDKKLRRIGKKEFTAMLEDEGLESDRKSVRDEFGTVVSYFVIRGISKKDTLTSYGTGFSDEPTDDVLDASNTGNTCNTDLPIGIENTIRKEGTDWNIGITTPTSITTDDVSDDKNEKTWDSWLNEQPGGTAPIGAFIAHLKSLDRAVSIEKLLQNGEIYEPKPGMVRCTL